MRLKPFFMRIRGRDPFASFFLGMAGVLVQTAMLTIAAVVLGRD
jgi:hypothetical protein